MVALKYTLLNTDQYINFFRESLSMNIMFKSFIVFYSYRLIAKNCMRLIEKRP